MVGKKEKRYNGKEGEYKGKIKDYTARKSTQKRGNRPAIQHTIL